jgi:short-subunit dehydrogenase involved in D-alanine esterification of teichoic acids
MRVTGNTMLITGGSSGIGRALAHEFHALGNRVIVSGRNAAALEAVAAAHPGMKFLTVDMNDAAVRTGLMGEHQASDPNAMPLADYIAETMRILRSQPGVTEVCVERVKPLRSAGESGPEKYEEMFRAFNDRVTSAAHA